MRTYNEEQRAKLRQLIAEGTNVKQEVQDLSEGLRETVKAVADEMQINHKYLTKPSMLLSKVIWLMYKNRWMN